MKMIGDVHLGRQFKNGVPLHRRGHRERMVRQSFVEALNQKADLIIQVGDIFDKFRVDLNDVMFAYRTIAAVPNTVELVFIAGNHDLSKDLEKVSSFNILAELCSGLKNVHFFTEPSVLRNILVCPWSPTKSASEMLKPFEGQTFDLVVGHWDRVSPRDDFNLIPLEQLSKITKHAVSGHDHTPVEYTYGDLKVTFTGSLRPYSHAEDPGEQIYVTRMLSEVIGHEDEFKDKCLRILLPEGEIPPTDIDCLQLTFKKVGSGDDDILAVDFEEGLDMLALFEEVTIDIDPDVRDMLKAKFMEVRSA